MSNHNTFLILAGAAVAIGALEAYKRSGKVRVENFSMNPPRIARVEKTIGCANGTSSFFTIPGTQQALLNPRQAGMVDYGANIRYNFPDKAHMAPDMGSIAPRTVIREGYGVQNQVAASPANGQMVDALGQLSECQPVVYDRYIYANQKSRLYGGGDPIRGDLPIVPLAKGWFSPAATPQTMLRDGAIAAMAGVDNDTSKELLALKSAIAGTSTNTGSGTRYTVQKSMYSQNAGGDIAVTAFP